MRDDFPQEIQSLIAQCEVNVSRFTNDQMSAALHWGETQALAAIALKKENERLEQQVAAWKKALRRWKDTCYSGGRRGMPVDLFSKADLAWCRKAEQEAEALETKEEE